MIIDLKMSHEYTGDRRFYSLRLHYFENEYILEIVDVAHGSPDTNFYTDIIAIVNDYKVKYRDIRVRAFINMEHTFAQIREIVEKAEGEWVLNIFANENCNVTEYLLR